MTQNYEVTDTVERNRRTRIVVLKTENHQLPPVIETIHNVIESRWPIKDFKTVLEGKGRPRLESENDGEIYFRQRETGEIEVRLSMASDEVREHVVETLMESQSSGLPQEQTKTEASKPEEPKQGRYVEPPNGGDNTISFVPPFSKDEVDFKTRRKKDNSAPSCKDCVHYAGNGQCSMVKGDIGREDYCEDLYADLQVNGRVKDGGFKTNLIAKGDNFMTRVKETSVQEIVESISKALRSRL